MIRDHPIIDSDTHVNVPLSALVERVPEKFKVPVPDRPGMVMTNAVGISPLDWKMQADDEDRRRFRAGAIDPAERINDMNIDYVDVHVLYGGGRPPSDDKESVVAYIRAYNDWLSEYCSYAPDRLFGPASVPPTGIDDAIAEAERVAGMTGICGLMLNSWPAGSHSFPRPDEDERFWAVAEDLDLPVVAHVGLGGDGEGDESALQGLTDPRTRFPHINKERMAVYFVDITSHLILGGVLDRHPNLRFGCIESGIGWVPFFLEQTEDNWSRHRFWANSMLSMRPSDFWNRQCFVTFQIDHFGMQNRDAVGIDTIMWSSDYPHSGAEWPDSQRIIDDHFRGVSAEDTRKILCDNAARLYGLDVEKLGRFGVPKFTPAGTAA